jgi:hypothetical protein
MDFELANYQLKKLSEIKENSENPRYITEKDFNGLVDSIKNFPEMLTVKPIIIDENSVILGGNMRLKACSEAGFDKVPTIKIEGWNEEQKKEFIIKDNVHSGRWDSDALANGFDTELLINWGLNTFVPEDIELNDFFAENEDNTENEEDNGLKSIVLNYVEEEYIEIKDKLSKIASTPEEAIRILLTK